MQPECFYHAPRSNWAYPYQKDVFHLRVRTKKDDVHTVFAVTGDKYDWERCKEELEMRKTATDQWFDYWEASIRPRHRRFSYAFRFHAGDEALWMTEAGIFAEEPFPAGGYFEVPYIHEVDLFAAPEWAKSAVFYQIMPDRFANGDSGNDPEGTLEWGAGPTLDSHFGGDLQGIIDHLDYLSDLGITALYLTPVFAAPSYHKYDTTDYYAVDPQFGDTKLLKKLIQYAHDRDIKVVLDAVLNHTHLDFPPFQDVLEHGEQSQYADWFHIDSFPVRVGNGEQESNYATFGFYEHMPKLNTANPEVKKYLFDVATFWLKEVQADGWRLDVANEIDHHFWRGFRETVKSVNPEAYLIGEVWSNSMNWLLGDQFDSVMNYPFADRVLRFFQEDGQSAEAFAAEISNLLVRYPQQVNEVIFNLLGSHDTPRVLTLCGEDKRRLKLAIVFLFTYIGTPCIFYGDEIGLKGDDDPDCRKCMEWDPDRQDRELYDFYKLMIALRKEHKVLRSGFFRFLQANADERGIIYERIDDNSHFIVWMNNTGQQATLSHPIKVNDWQDALTSEPVETVDGRMDIALEPLGYRIIYRQL